MTKLIRVVFKPDLQVMEVVVKDADGVIRRIDVNWITKDKTSAPLNWWDMVCAEVEFQRSNRGLPF